MKLTHFKTVALMLSATALLALNGCGGTTGTTSDSGLAELVEIPVPDAITSTVTASPASVVADGTTSTVTVTVNDASSNPILDATVTLAQDIGSSSTISDVTNVGDGTYTFDVNSTTVEVVTYTATAGSVEIADTAEVTFTDLPVVPPVPDATTSTLTASPASVLADGTTSTVTVTVKDASSDPILDATVTLAQAAGASTISAVTNVGDGTYTFNVNSITVETVTYTATAGSVVITQTTDVTFTNSPEVQCLLDAGGYGTIVINGKTWFDRNLGASEVAANVNDTAAFGDLYQWGRSTEGHQDRLSDYNDTLATTVDDVQNTDWEGKFIVAKSSINRDWVDSAVDDNGSIRSDSWSTPYDEVTNPNQVCPCGYIVPTRQDFADLNITGSNDTDTFKLVYAGYRAWDTNITYDDGVAYFWTNTRRTDGATSYRFIPGGGEGTASGLRAYGLSIRCIKP